MKTLSMMPLQSAINKILEPVYKERPVLLPVESNTYPPFDTRRFIRNLREYRQYNYSRDFVH